VIPFRNYLRDKKSLQNLLGRYYEGADVSTNKNWVPAPDDENYVECSQCFEFNRELLGWHYGWISNKHRADDPHVFSMAVYHRRPAPCSGSGSSSLVTPESHSLHLIGQGASPPFRVKSARRKTRGGGAKKAAGSGARMASASPALGRVPVTAASFSSSSSSRAVSRQRAPPMSASAGASPRTPGSPRSPSALISDENSLRASNSVSASDDLRRLEHRFQQLTSAPQTAKTKTKTKKALPSSSSFSCSSNRPVTPPPSSCNSSSSQSQISPSPRHSSSDPQPQPQPQESQSRGYGSTVVRKKPRSGGRSRCLEILPVTSRSELETAAGQGPLYLQTKEEKRLSRLAIFLSLRRKEQQLKQLQESASAVPCASVRSVSTSSSSCSSLSTDDDQLCPLPSRAATISMPAASLSHSHHGCPDSPPLSAARHSRNRRIISRGGSGDWSTTALSALSLFSSSSSCSYQSKRPPDFDALFGHGGLEAEDPCSSGLVSVAMTTFSCCTTTTASTSVSSFSSSSDTPPAPASAPRL
jgi:hypothetical protein